MIKLAIPQLPLHKLLRTRKLHSSVFNRRKSQQVYQTPCSDTFSISSTDQSLREAVKNFDELVDFDSELFDAGLEKFIEDDKFQN